ncbi:hypothetical protein AV530_004676 [Patagioenas fasciata monilis]|uniref:Uncharacterized protein n=1 Tax=Patagioenas fasciata monilis TaxID=372326 RepID=A0A1V4KHU4_PATFA|nr:hypothetical protein AV530_004676 [Patagioenas fasciata monilis]
MPSVGYARLYSPSCNLLIARSTGSGEKKSTEGADPVPWMKKMSADCTRRHADEWSLLNEESNPLGSSGTIRRQVVGG